MKYTIEISNRDLTSLCIACTSVRRAAIAEAQNPNTTAERREICERTAKYWEGLRANLRAQREAADMAEKITAAPQEQEAPAQEAQEPAEIMQQAAQIALPERVALYVPSTTDTDKPTDNAAQVERVAREFCGWFGGATAQQSAGYWISDTAGLVREAVTIVYAACTAAQLREHLPDVLQLAQQIKAEMQQEALSCELDGKLYII